MIEVPKSPNGKIELYGRTPFLDDALDKILNLDPAKELKRLGAIGIAAGIITFGVDTAITANAADMNGFRKQTPARTRFTTQYRGLRPTFEIAMAVAGVFLLGVSTEIDFRKKQKSEAKRNQIMKS